jgi:hypothetical protein
MSYHEIMYADQTAVKKISSKSMSQPPPPPPRTRKGSSFPLQVFGTRMYKVHPDNRKSCVVAGNVEGSLSCLIPIDEKVYKRLALLQQMMCVLIPTPFALNPKEYRYPKVRSPKIPEDGTLSTGDKRFILDGCIVSKFLCLNTAIQDELASIMGTSAYIIRENLHEIDYLSRSF